MASYGGLSLGRSWYGYGVSTGVSVDPTLTLRQNFLLNAGSSMAQAVVVGPTFTHARNSLAWDIDENGLLYEAAINSPAFGHNMAGTPNGLGIWEARTNSALQSRDATNSVWVKTNITAAKNATGLDGIANSASTLTATAANGTCLQTIATASAAKTLSTYVKRVTGSGDIDLTIDGGTSWTTLTGLSSGDFTRYDLTQTLGTTNIGFRIVTSGDAIEFDVVSQENGAFATPPIVTAGSAVTRAVTTVNMSDVSWFNDGGPGTVVFGANVPFVGAASAQAFSVDDGSSVDRIIYQRTSGVNSRFLSQSGSAVVIDINTGSVWSDGETRKIACAWDTNDAAKYNNGAAEGTDTINTNVSSISMLNLGKAFNASQHWNGYISEFKYFNERKPNAFLADITA